MNIRDTSLEVYDEIVGDGTAATQKRAILNLLIRLGGRALTRQEIARSLGLGITAVCGRVNELMKTGAVSDDERKVCAVTGRNVHAVRVMQTP